MKQLKKLTINDITEIYNLSVEQFGKEAWSILQIKDAFNNKSVSYYGIFDERELVCFACILCTMDDINLLDIATKESYKRQGFAKKMLTYLISLKKDGQSFSLEVKSKNIPAINLYTSFGFKTLNIRKKYYKDGDDALCMFLW